MGLSFYSMSESTRPKRRYDSSGRRRKAEATRARVVAEAAIFTEGERAQWERILALDLIVGWKAAGAEGEGADDLSGLGPEVAPLLPVDEAQAEVDGAGLEHFERVVLGADRGVVREAQPVEPAVAGQPDDIVFVPEAPGLAGGILRPAGQGQVVQGALSQVGFNHLRRSPSGSKNTALPLMAGAILAEGQTTLENVPNLPDGGPIEFRVTGKRGIDIGRDAHLDWTLPDPTRHISSKHVEVRYKDGVRPAWQLDITDARSIATFAREIGIFGKEEALARAVEAVSGRRYRTNRDLVPVAVWAARREGRMTMASATMHAPAEREVLDMTRLSSETDAQLPESGD